MKLYQGMWARRHPANVGCFTVSASEWDCFIEMLERPAKTNPGLAKLFAKSSVFTGQVFTPG